MRLLTSETARDSGRAEIEWLRGGRYIPTPTAVVKIHRVVLDAVMLDNNVARLLDTTDFRSPKK